MRKNIRRIGFLFFFSLLAFMSCTSAKQISFEKEYPWDTASQDCSELMQSATSDLTRPKTIGTYYESVVPDTLDLAERARLGLNHFVELTSEEHNYEMYWGSQPLGLPKEALNYAGFDQVPGHRITDTNPPILNLWWSPLHACQPKCMEAMAMLRLMSGSTQGLETEAHMVKMMASLVEEGLYWVPADPKKHWLGELKYRPHANMHGQGRMMRAMQAWYEYTGNPTWKKLLDEMIEGMDRIAVHKKDYAYFPTRGHIPHEYFRSSYVKGLGWKDTREPRNEKDGEEGSLFNHQGHLPGVMATWYGKTGNQKALDLSGQLVRFYTKPQFWADNEKGDYPGVVGSEHAHWRGHLHGHVNVLRAILEYALVANDVHLKSFVRDGYEWGRQNSFARIGYVGDGQGCGCGRMIGLAVKLTEAGVGDYWEDVDLYIRNHGTEMQFTPEDIPLIEEAIKDKPAPPKKSYLGGDGLIANIGGYSNHVPPYKTSTSLCCSPHGNMGLFYAWDGMLRFNDGIARVNLLLNRASPGLDIDSYLPFEGKVVLKNKKSHTVFVRIPLWVDKNSVRCRIGKRTVQVGWLARYLRVDNLKETDVVTIEFPMAERTETWTAPKASAYTMNIGADKAYTCRFKGNTLVEMTPTLSEGSWIYQQRPLKFKANKASMKQVKRYVTEQILEW